MRPQEIIVEADLAARLRALLGEMADDEDLTLDMIEGETSLMELLDALMSENAEDVTMVHAIKERLSDLSDRRKRIEKRVDARKRLAQTALDHAGLRKVERPEYTASLRAVPPGVEIVDADALPDEYVRIKREPDETKLKAALTDGAPVAGARLTNGGETISIRTK